MPVGLPPIRPVRDEAQRPVPGPGRLAHRFRPAAGHPLGGPRCPERRRARCSAQAARWERQQQNGRGIPGHVRVVPGDDSETVFGRVRARCAEEVVSVEQGGLAGRSNTRGEGDHTAHRSGRSLPVRLTNGQHPPAVGRGAESSVTVHFVRRRWPAQGRGCRPVRCGAVTEPHPLVRLVDVGERTGGPAGHRGTARPRRTR